MTVTKILWKNHPFWSFYEVLLLHKYFWYIILTMKRRLIWNFYRKTFCFFIFTKWKKYYKLAFDNTLKMYCCELYWSKFKLHNQAVLNYGPLDMLFRFFRCLIYVYLASILSKTLSKNHHFLTETSKIHFKM